MYFNADKERNHIVGEVQMDLRVIYVHDSYSKNFALTLCFLCTALCE